MTSRIGRLPPGALVAAVASAAMIAQQVAGKATRDALFLSSFSVKMLPAMMAGSAVFSLLAVLWLSRMMLRHSPAKVVPAGFGLSGVTLLASWALSFSAPRLAAVLLYLYTALFGAAMISAFWSLVNETFDPHTSRRSVAAITNGGTLGGLLGGLAAWRASALIDVPTMLPLLAALSAVSCWGSLRMRGPEERPAAMSEVADPGGTLPSPVSILRESPYLRNLAIVVALGAVTSGLLEYVFSAEAVKAYAKGPALLSFFSLFWVAVGVLSFVLQSMFGRLALEKLGLAVTLALLPGVVVLGGAVGLAVPGLWSTAILRGAEATHRNSLFRTAYEMLYTPVSERRKRATKTLIDVGFDRLGTMTAAGTTMVAVALAAARAEAALLTLAIACAMVSLVRSRALHKGYVEVLEESLRKGSEAVAPSILPAQAHDKVEVRDKIVERLEVLAEPPVRAEEKGADRGTASVDAWLPAIADLRSREADRVRRVLSAEVPLPRPLVSFAILLLADKEFHADAIRALSNGVSKTRGQLVDALCDPDVDFDIRRRIPRVLSACADQHTIEGLILGTEDERFEVRYECGRAMTKIHRADSRIVIPEAAVIAIVKQELALSKDVSESQPTLDLDDEENEPPALIDRLLRDRIDRSLEHVFTLLALVLDRESLRLAFKALHEKDERLRGTALEYLETVLPDDIRDAVWPFLGEARPMRTARAATEILADLRRASTGPERDLAVRVSA
jgi:AAA family ATP:ADP antiporter